MPGKSAAKKKHSFSSVGLETAFTHTVAVTGIPLPETRQPSIPPGGRENFFGTNRNARIRISNNTTSIAKTTNAGCGVRSQPEKVRTGLEGLSSLGLFLKRHNGCFPKRIKMYPLCHQYCYFFLSE
jgi:hypothetical protein